MKIDLYAFQLTIIEILKISDTYVIKNYIKWYQV